MNQLSENNEEILQLVLEAESALLPTKSRAKYEKIYQQFCQWRNGKNVEGVDEIILMAYFCEKVKTLKSSTLWSVYSMLKSTIQINENVDISAYKKLLAYLKRQNDGYVAKKSKVLSMDNVKDFLNKAPDNSFLLMKVVTIVALHGACRAEELRLLKVDDVEDTGHILVVTLHDTKTKKKHVFTITSQDGINGIQLFRKYLNLRPKHVNHSRLFICYKGGKCTVQPIGINTFYNIPRKIATYLGLPDPNSFTGHCFRRTSATFLADSGADIQVLKRHGGWRSSGVAESYVEESIENKVKVSKRIFSNSTGETSAAPSTSTSVSITSSEEMNNSTFAAHEVRSLSTSSAITFSNLSNCTFTIYANKLNE